MEERLHADAEGLVVAVDKCPVRGLASAAGAADAGEDRGDDLVAEGEQGGDGIDAAHRVHAWVENSIRTGKDRGIGKLPSQSLAINGAWLAASLIAATLIAWLQLIALDGDLAAAEPRTLRCRVLHAAARLVRGARRRQLRIPATWPWADDITAAWQQITALPHAP